MPRAEIRIDGAEVDVLRRVLAPEAGRDIAKARIRLRAKGRTLFLLVEAKDTGTLRAALNSYLRWADVTMGVVEEVRP